MAIIAFKLGPSKGLALAQLDSVPAVLVVVGPNGAGKSTLLDLLRSKIHGVEFEGATRFFYLNPDRPWRKTTLNSASAFGFSPGYRDLMEQDRLPGFKYGPPGGFIQTNLLRHAGNADDIQSLVKLIIVKMENRRRTLIAAHYDLAGDVFDKRAVPDLFAPFRALVSTLLPHLRFARVDGTNEDDQRVLFEKLDLLDTTLIDLDDLSSGERAVIGMFLPFVESQVERILDPGKDSGNPKPVVIIDEPELHLHPALQVKLMTYVRDLAEQGEAQFIIATHSPTIMDSLAEDELYLLAPPNLVGDGNQLVRVSSSAEQLEVVRELTGSTYAVTRCRPIVFVEGMTPDETEVSDQRLMEMLMPGAMGWVLVPSGGRSQAIEAATKLRERSLTGLPGIAVFALIDLDQGRHGAPDFAINWPVCMVENLLLDSQGIWSILAPHKEKVGIFTQGDLDRLLHELVADQCTEEIRLRVVRAVKPFRLHINIEEYTDVLSLGQKASDKASDHLSKIGGEQGIVQARAAAEAAVDQIVSAGQALERFHGKMLLRQFYERYAKRAGFSYSAFCYQLAQSVRNGERLQRIVEIPMRKIKLYIPLTLTNNLQEARTLLVGQSEHAFIDQACGEVANARCAWEEARPESGDRQQLRRSVLRVARTVKTINHDELYGRILTDLSQLGTG